MALAKARITKKGRTSVYTVPPNKKATVNISVHGIQASNMRLAVTNALEEGFDAAPLEALPASVTASNSVFLNRYSLNTPFAPSGVQAFGETTGTRQSLDLFGAAVTMSRDGQWAAVGIPQDNAVTTDSGAVEIFRLVNGTWSFHQRINQTDGTSSATSYVGSSVCMSADGSYLVVLQSNSNPRIHFYFRASATGQYSLQQTIIIPSVGDSSGTYNQNVSITDLGDRVALGIWNDNGTTGGQVRIYTRSGVAWTTAQTINNPSAAGSDQFGCSVSLSGDGSYLAIGENGDDDTAGDSGKAHVYLLQSGTYTSQQVFKAPTPQASGFYGFSVAMSQDGLTLAVGEFNRTVGGSGSAGQAYVYTRSGTTWTLQATLAAPLIQANERFGWRVALGGATGDFLLVGAYLFDNTTTDQGAVYTFIRSGTTWPAATRIVSSAPQASAEFGWAICATPMPYVVVTADIPAFTGEFFQTPSSIHSSSISDASLLVGAYRHDSTASDDGRVEFISRVTPIPTSYNTAFAAYSATIANEVLAQLDKRNGDLMDRFSIQPLKTFERTGIVIDAGESIVLVTDATTDVVAQVRGFEKEV